MRWHVTTPADSGIDSFQDIADNEMGVKWAPNEKGTGDEWITSEVIEEYGFDYDDIEEWGGKMDFVSISDGLEQLRDGHINLYSAHTLPPNTSFIEATNSLDTNFLYVDDDVINSLNEKYDLIEATIPAETYEGQDEDVKTVTMPMTIFVREDIPEDIVYDFTKMLDEETDYLTDVHQVFENFDVDEAWEDTGVELHPGAEKYYEEIDVMEE